MPEKKARAVSRMISSAATSLFRVQKTEVSKPRPRIALTKVGAGPMDTAVLTGWALTTAQNWFIVLKDQHDKIIPGNLALNLHRGDVAVNYPEYFNSNAGWEFEISRDVFRKLTRVTAELICEDGRELAVLEINQAALPELLPETKAGDLLPLRAAISRIDFDEMAKETVISGWALAPDERLILILRDGSGKVLSGNLQKDIYRPDIALKFPEYLNENAGWELRCARNAYKELRNVTLELFTRSDRLKIEKAFDPAQTHLINPQPTPPRVSISSATLAEDHETLTVRGWRLSPDKAAFIVIKDAKGSVIDGAFNLNIPRLDLASKYPTYVDSHAGWEFSAKISKGRAVHKITAELISEGGQAKAVYEIETPFSQDSLANGPISVELARFNPQRRQLIAEGRLAAPHKVEDLIFMSSAGRRYTQVHVNKLSGDGKLRRWRFQTPCSGLEEGETLIVRLPSFESKEAKLPIEFDKRGAEALNRMSKVMAPPASEPLVSDEVMEESLKNLAVARQEIETRDGQGRVDFGRAAYFPVFENVAEITNHYHRAAWYLTGEASPIREIIIARINKNLVPNERPDHFCAPNASVDSISIVDDIAAYYRTLCKARLILLWSPVRPADMSRLKELLPGAQFLTVATNDLSSTEYGSYCKAQWSALKSDERNALLVQSREKFSSALTELRARGKTASAVFGTGPSIEKAFSYDFSECATIVCNTTVADKDLMDHIDPAFVCAGDVVSHFGVSAYAERFRENLVQALRTRDILFFTSAIFGYLLSVKFPDIAEKIIFCDQRHFGANVDLKNVWSLPKLDSTLNIHMLPIAATFSDTIFVLGCDGKNPDPEKNEDFWAHSTRTHYHELVESGHLAHPTFDVRRQASTFSRYLDSTEESFQAGELAGKVYFSLEPSFTPALKARPVPGHYLAASQNGRLRLMAQPETRLAAVAEPRRVLIVSKSPPHLFSGGRYHAAMIAEALVQRGHDVVMWMDNKPYWWSYLALNPNHSKIRFWLNDFDNEPEGPFDIVIIIPDSSSDPKAYLAALNCAQFNGAKTVLMNYESPNWYNELAPEPRDPVLWAFWYASAAYCDMILSLGAEGTRYARQYYNNVQEHCLFSDAGSSINTYAADIVAQRSIEPINQVICISRFGSFSKHKNVDAVIRTIPPEMKGYTLALVAGTAPLPNDDSLDEFTAKLERKGVKLKILHGISDIEKFEEIAKSKLMVFQSNFEGLGYPPLEAQYMGRPCVVFDLPILREFSDGNISFIERGNYRAFRDEVGRILQDFSSPNYSHLKEAIASKATISAFSDRMQTLLDCIMEASNMAVDAFDDRGFQRASEAYSEGVRQQDNFEDSLVAPAIDKGAESIDIADIRKYVRAALQKDINGTSVELIDMLSDANDVAGLAPLLTRNVKSDVWVRPEIFTTAARIEQAAQYMTAAESARSLMAVCAWALPETFDKNKFVAKAVETCQTYEQTLGLLRRQLRDKEGLLALKGANLKFATEQDLPVLFDEIILRRSYYFQTNNPTPYIIDGGANFGLATYGFLRQFPDAQIVAFEPGRLGHAALMENVHANTWRNVKVYQAALADDEGMTDFNEPQHMSMGGSITARLKGGTYRVDSYQVQTLPLSRFIDRPVDLLKLDIEGAEISVLKEIENELYKVRRLFVEVHATEEYSSLEAMNRVVRLLSKAGFACYCEPARVNSAQNKFTKNGAGSYVVWAAQ